MLVPQEKEYKITPSPIDKPPTHQASKLVSFKSNNSPSDELQRTVDIINPAPKFIPLPTKISRGPSLTLMKHLTKPRRKRDTIGPTAVASFQEMTRLISLNDEQKVTIQKLIQEVKTLKIVI